MARNILLSRILLMFSSLSSMSSRSSDIHYADVKLIILGLFVFCNTTLFLDESLAYFLSVKKSNLQSSLHLFQIRFRLLSYVAKLPFCILVITGKKKRWRKIKKEEYKKQNKTRKSLKEKGEKKKKCHNTCYFCRHMQIT